MKIAELLDAALHPVVAAAVGSIVGLKAVPGASLGERMTNLVASFALAVYGGPALIEHMGVSSVKIGAGIVFLVGAAGLVVFNACIEAFRQTDLAAWLTGWLPRRKGD